MTTFRTLARTFLAKAESPSGTDAVPVVGTDAIRVENPVLDPDLETFTTNEVRRSIDRSTSAPAGGRRPFSCDVLVRGSGSGGTAPQFGTLLRGSAMSETTLGTAITGTAQGGTASTLQLAASDVSSDGQYHGVTVRLTGGTGSGQERVIVGSTASTDTVDVYPDWSPTPDGTSQYSIDPYAVYQPASSSLETLTLYEYVHAGDGGNDILHKGIGAAASASFAISSGNPGRFSFTGLGQLIDDTDVSDPGAATYHTTPPRPLLSADCYLGGVSVPLSSLQFNMNGSVQLDQDPREAYGYNVASVVDRGMGGSLQLPLARVAARDVIAAWKDSTVTRLWLRWGTVAGNRNSFLLENIEFKSQSGTDAEGRAHVTINFELNAEDNSTFYNSY